MNMAHELKSVFLVFVLLAGTLAVMGCLDDDDDDGDEDQKIMIAGKSYTIHSLFEKMSTVTITGSDDKEYTGIPLSDLVNDTELADPDTREYEILASDGYKKNLTWEDLYRGVLVKEDTMSAFTHLPGKYRIRDITEIKAIDSKIIEVNGWLYCWDQPFDKLEETSMFDDEDTNHTGVLLSDLVNDTGLKDQGNHNYTITAADGYAKTVSWENMTEGLLVKEQRKSVFPDMEKKYWIKDIVKIEVVV